MLSSSFSSLQQLIEINTGLDYLPFLYAKLLFQIATFYASISKELRKTWREITKIRCKLFSIQLFFSTSLILTLTAFSLPLSVSICLLLCFYMSVSFCLSLSVFLFCLCLSFSLCPFCSGQRDEASDSFLSDSLPLCPC